MPEINYVKNSKLAETLRLLAPDEVKMLGKWLNSPWCNSNKKVYELYLLLKKHYPTFEGKNLSKTDIFEKLYPEKAFNDRWLRNLMAECNKQIESFMVHQRLREEEDNQRQLMLAREYEKRNASKRAVKNLNEIIESVNAIPNKSTDDYLQLVHCHNTLYQSPHLRAKKLNKGLILKNGDHFLDHFYLLHKWQYQTEIAERKKLIKEDFNNLIDFQILIQLNPTINLPAISFYKNRIASEVIIPKEKFLALKTNFEENFQLISTKDQKIIYFYLLNTGIRIGYSDAALDTAVFKFYLFGVKNKYNIIYGILSVITYCNIIIIGNNAKEFELVSKFIDQCHMLLPRKYRTEGKIWGTAHAKFYQEDYLSALQHLRFANFSSNALLIRSRYLLSVTYFKIRQQDSSYISFSKDYNLAYLKFLKRLKGTNPNFLKSYLNSIKYITLLSEALESPDLKIETFKTIHKNITAENPVAGKPWLLSEATKIINSFK